MDIAVYICKCNLPVEDPYRGVSLIILGLGGTSGKENILKYGIHMQNLK